MQQGKDFNFSYSLTASSTAYHIVLCWEAIMAYGISGIDVVNCCQSNSIDIKRQLFMKLPHQYKEWFYKTHPGYKYDMDPDDIYVLQTINKIQVRVDTGQSWYLLLKLILENSGFKMCLAKPALFVYWDDKNCTVTLTSTNYLLGIHINSAVFHNFCVLLDKYVDIKAQTNIKVLKYLNNQIIQLDMGVSFDQTHHIQTTILDR